MKKIILIASLLMAGGLWAYNETDLLKLRAINKCPSCDLSEALLLGFDLSKANLSKANLSKANLSNANLRYANLIKVDLSGANLSGANLSGANLLKADLSNTDLTTSNLRNINLYQTIFCNTQTPWGELNDGCE